MRTKKKDVETMKLLVEVAEAVGYRDVVCLKIPKGKGKYALVSKSELVDRRGRFTDDGFDIGYAAAMGDLEHWVEMWVNFHNQALGEGNMEEHQRVATVTNSGGTFLDFIVRELVFFKGEEQS